MRQAFTMIELVFVIVIIGILAAVAVLKLSATRTDAKISAEVQSAKIALSNLGAEFTTKNEFLTDSEDSANASVKCFTFSAYDNGNVEIEMISTPNTGCPSDVHRAVQELASGSILTSTGSLRVHAFGGSTLVK